MPTSRFTLVSTLAAAVLAPSVHAFDIVLDYTYDTGGFFSNVTAKAALEAAAADLSAVLTNTLNPVATDVFTGTNGSTTATADWSLYFTNPGTGATEFVSSFTFATDEYRVYVGARLLGGSTLGQGGPGSAGVNFSGGGFSEEWVGAVDALEAISNTAMLRGSGPTIDTLSGSLTLGDTPAAFDLNFGLTVGNLWFDTDSDWHFDHTTAVAAGKSDLYSVALHELIHTLGVGGSQSWNDNRSGSTWLGAEGIAEKGGDGVGFLNPAADHLATGTISSTYFGNDTQEVVMDPDLTTGTRKYLTALDLAVLRDLGFETVSPVPEPASAAAFGALAALAFGATRRRRRS
jgi:hypothetical protein